MARFKANYHSHTKKSRYSTLTVAQTIKIAQDLELNTIGFSEHSNLPDANGTFRIQNIEELNEYIETINRLKVEHENTIEVLCGLLVEVTDPYSGKNNVSWINYLSKQPGVDYIILGHHNYRNGVHVAFGKPEGHLMVEHYIDDFASALQNCNIAYVARPDMYLRGFGEWNSETEFMAREMCRIAKQAQVPFGLTINGMYNEEGFGYPNENFWKIVKEYDIPAILEVDSFNEECWDETKISKAYQFAEKMELKVNQYLKFKQMD